MAAGKDHRAPHEIIETERIAYLDALPPPDLDWPPDVRVLYHAIQRRLFEEGLRVNDVRKRCGLGNHNISSRFKWHIGRTPKRYILHHRMTLAKQLLRYEQVAVTQVAFGIGYGSTNAFSATFRRWVGCSPSRHKDRLGEK